MESANIVGYTTNEIEKDSTALKYTMMSIPFTSVDGSGISLQDINFANPTLGLGFDTADEVLLWLPDVQTYEKYYLYGVKGYEDVLPPTWKSNADDTPFDTAHPNGLPAGTVFWYYAKATSEAGSMTVSGQVADDSYVTFEIGHATSGNNYYFVANPYPTALNIAWDGGQVDWGEATLGLGFDTADEILIWDPSVQTYVKYYIYGVKGYESQLVPTWKSNADDSLFSSAYPNGLPVGTPFWYYSKKADTAITQTIKFNNPL